MKIVNDGGYFAKKTGLDPFDEELQRDNVSLTTDEIETKLNTTEAPPKERYDNQFLEDFTC